MKQLEIASSFGFRGRLEKKTVEKQPRNIRQDRTIMLSANKKERKTNTAQN